MSEAHLRVYAREIYEYYQRNKLPTDNFPLANAYTRGFADGVSWLIRRCATLGISIPDGDLFLTEETAPLQ